MRSPRCFLNSCLAVFLSIHLVPQLAAQPEKPAEEKPAPPPLPLITIPVAESRSLQKLQAARDYLKVGSWIEALGALQGLLDTGEDRFLPGGIPWDGKKPVVWRSTLRQQTLKLLEEMPEGAKVLYDAQTNPRAVTVLAKAGGADEYHLLASVVARYRHTRAGTEALERLARLLGDRGDLESAAGAYQSLLERSELQGTPALLRAATTFRHLQARELETRVWQKLSEDPKYVEAGGLARDREITRLLALPRDPLPVWSVFRGGAQRQSVGVGELPFLVPSWTTEVAGPVSRPFLENAERGLRLRRWPVLPGPCPLVTPDRILFRASSGIRAVKRADGRELWFSPSPMGLESAIPYYDKMPLLRTLFATDREDFTRVTLAHSLTGILSTDGQRVFSVDDLAIPFSSVSRIQEEPPVLPVGILRNAGLFNRIKALDVDTGTLLWQIGGPGAGPLDQGHFLGAPLPVHGTLYALHERSGEIRLVALDPATGQLRWSQGLAVVTKRLQADPLRRLRGVHLAYARGLLLCPTDAGAVVAVDPVARRLVWAFLYPSQDQDSSEVRLESILGKSWRVSAPTVMGQRVLIPPGDNNFLYTLDIHTGELLWQGNREGDLFVGAADAERALIVGPGRMRALSATDGRVLWKRTTGLPSGQGALAQGSYFLPVEAAPESGSSGIHEVDMTTGATRGFARRHGGEFVGNLALAGSHLVSQGPIRLACYPLLSDQLARIDRQLTQQPRNFHYLLERSLLRSDQGQFSQALQEIQQAEAAALTSEERQQVQKCRHDTLLQTMRQDFRLGQARISELKASCQIPIISEATIAEKNQIAEEIRRREANSLLVIARGLHNSGQLVEALAHFVRLHQGVAQLGSRWCGGERGWQAMDEPNSHPPLLSAEVWLRGRVAEVMDAVTSGQVPEMEKEIQKLRTLIAPEDLEGLKRFVTLFGSTTRVGAQSRLELARRWTAGAQPRWLEAEIQLIFLVRQKHFPDLAGLAADELTRLYFQAGFVEDALTPYPGIDNKDRGMRFGEDPRVLPYLATLWPKRRYRNLSLAGSFEGHGPFLPLEVVGDIPPLLRRERLTIDLAGGQLKLVNAQGEERMAEPLGMGVLRQLLVRNPTEPMARVRCHSYGHLVIFTLEKTVYAVDLWQRRLRWKRNLSMGAKPNPQQVQVSGDGHISVVYADGTSVPLATVGPVFPDSVSVATMEGLFALDPLQGTPLWMRPFPGLSGEVGGDSCFVYLDQGQNPSDSAGEESILRASDGSPVAPAGLRGKPYVSQRLSPAWIVDKQNQHWAWTDPATGIRAFDLRAPKEALFFDSMDQAYAGFVTKEGTLEVHDVYGRRRLWTSKVEKEHLTGIKTLSLLTDRSLMYLMMNAEQGDTQNLAFPHVTSGLRTQPVNGPIYAFDRETGVLRWHNDSVRRQNVLLDHMESCPFLLFVAGQRARNESPLEAAPSVASIEKRTGKSYLLGFELPKGTKPFHHIRIDPARGIVDLISESTVLRHAPVE